MTARHVLGLDIYTIFNRFMSTEPLTRLAVRNGCLERLVLTRGPQQPLRPSTTNVAIGFNSAIWCRKTSMVPARAREVPSQRIEYRSETVPYTIPLKTYEFTMWRLLRSTKTQGITSYLGTTTRA